MYLGGVRKVLKNHKLGGCLNKLQNINQLTSRVDSAAGRGRCSMALVTERDRPIYKDFHMTQKQCDFLMVPLSQKNPENVNL